MQDGLTHHKCTLWGMLKKYMEQSISHGHSLLHSYKILTPHQQHALHTHILYHLQGLSLPILISILIMLLLNLPFAIQER